MGGAKRLGKPIGGLLEHPCFMLKTANKILFRASNWLVRRKPMNNCPRILIVLAVALALSNSRAAGKVSFESDVKPLFSQYCYGCHGEKKKGGLDLRIYNDLASAKKDPQVF